MNSSRMLMLIMVLGAVVRPSLYSQKSHEPVPSDLLRQFSASGGMSALVFSNHTGRTFQANLEFDISRWVPLRPMRAGGAFELFPQDWSVFIGGGMGSIGWEATKGGHDQGSASEVFRSISSLSYFGAGLVIPLFALNNHPLSLRMKNEIVSIAMSRPNGDRNTDSPSRGGLITGLELATSITSSLSLRLGLDHMYVARLAQPEAINSRYEFINTFYDAKSLFQVTATVSIPFGGPAAASDVTVEKPRGYNIAGGENWSDKIYHPLRSSVVQFVEMPRMPIVYLDKSNKECMKYAQIKDNVDQLLNMLKGRKEVGEGFYFVASGEKIDQQLLTDESEIEKTYNTKLASASVLGQNIVRINQKLSEAYDKYDRVVPEFHLFLSARSFKDIQIYSKQFFDDIAQASIKPDQIIIYIDGQKVDDPAIPGLNNIVVLMP